MYDFTFQQPASIAEAAKTLAADADAKALAGGMTFIPVLKQRLNKPSAVVDLASLGLSGITSDATTITIGAMTNHHDIANSDIMVLPKEPGCVRVRLSGGTVQNAQAMARLIAASPDLLEACKLTLAWMQGQHLSVEQRNALSAAIDKAESRFTTGD